MNAMTTLLATLALLSARASALHASSLSPTSARRLSPPAAAAPRARCLAARTATFTSAGVALLGTAPRMAWADIGDVASVAKTSGAGVSADNLPPDSVIIAVVLFLLVGAGALQLSLGDMMNEVDNLPPSMGSQAKRERMKSGGFLKEDPNRR